MKGDGNLKTLIDTVIEDLHIPGIEDVVRRKALSSMRFHRDKRFWFTDRTHRFGLTAGRSEYRPGDGYGLPVDLVEIAGQIIWILRSGSDDQREECVRVPTSVAEWARVDWGNNRGTPEEWDYRTGALRLHPAPENADDVCEIRYLTNLGIPKAVRENSAWAYYGPNGEPLTTAEVDAWSNDWLTCEAGEAAVRARTMYTVQKEYLRDMEGAADMLGVWLEMVGQLEAETESKTTGITYLEGCLLD